MILPTWAFLAPARKSWRPLFVVLSALAPALATVPPKLIDLDASSISGSVGAAVTTWSDASGNGNDLTNTGSVAGTSDCVEPTLEEYTDTAGAVHRVVRFGGSGWDAVTCLQAGSHPYSTQSVGYEVWAVVRQPNTGTSSHNEPTQSPLLFDMGAVGATGFGLSYAAKQIFFYAAASHNGCGQQTKTMSETNYKLAVLRLRVGFGSGSGMRLEVNGQEEANCTHALAGLTSTEITTQPFLLGAQAKDGNGDSSRTGRYFRGELARFTIYDGLLDDATAAALHTQLATDYAAIPIPSPPPSPPPPSPPPPSPPPPSPPPPSVP